MAETQAVVPLALLVVGRVEPVKDRSEGSPPVCLPHTPGLPTSSPSPSCGPGPAEDSEKHHVPCK